MNRRRFSNLGLSVPVAGVALGLLCCWAGTSLAGSSSPPARAREYKRPSAEAVRASAEEILSEARFEERWSFWRWLSEKLFSGMDLDWGFDSAFWRIVGWVVVIWCSLTLVAILGHLVWTIWTVVSGGSLRREPSPRSQHFRGSEQLSYHQLVERMRQFADEGQFREALGVMMLALLRRLEELGAVSFHESKTNGDYVREFSPAFTCREEFGRFVTGFDSAVYGPTTKEQEAYISLRALFGRIGSNVAKRQEI